MKYSEKFLELKNMLLDKITCAESISEIEKQGKLERLLKIKEELQQEQFLVVVFGAFKSGKSTFLNGLLKQRILPEAVTRYTATITKVNYSSEPRIVIKWVTAEELYKRVISLIQYLNIRLIKGNREYYPQLGSLLNIDVEMTSAGLSEYFRKLSGVLKSIDKGTAFAEVKSITSENASDFLDYWNLLLNISENYDHHSRYIKTEIETENGSNIYTYAGLEDIDDYVAYKEGAMSKCSFVSEAEIYLDNDFLKNGITLIDLPGTGISADDNSAALNYAKDADVVLGVTVAGQALGKSDLEYLKELKNLMKGNLNLYMLVNRIDSVIANFKPQEETYKGRKNIIDGVAEKLKEHKLESIECIGVSSLAAVLANKASAEKKEKFRARIVPDFLGISSDDSDFDDFPTPDDFLESAKPYPEGKSWNHATDLLYRSILQNKGKFILCAANEKSINIITEVIQSLHSTRNNMDLELNKVQQEIEATLSEKKKVEEKKRNIKKIVSDADSTDFSKAAEKLINDVFKTVDSRITNTDKRNESLFRFLHDNLNTWINGGILNEYQNISQLNQSIKYFNQRLNDEVKDISLTFESKSISLPGQLSSLDFNVSEYRPKYTPAKAPKYEYRATWYKPWTWIPAFREKVLVEDGHPEKFSYETHEIKEHYKTQAFKMLNSCRESIETYCKAYLRTYSEQTASEVFEKIDSILSEKMIFLKNLKEQFAKTEKEKEDYLKYLADQETRIVDLQKQFADINTEISKIEAV